MKNLLYLIFYVGIIFLLKKIFMKLLESPTTKMFTPKDAETAIKVVKDIYGVDMARTVEKMFRLETAHFKSMQYIKTGSAGMEAGLWGKNLDPKDVEGTIKMIDNHTKELRDFIVWKSPTNFAIFLAKYIKRHGGNHARWNSTNITRQIAYNKRLETIKPRFV